MSKTLDIEAFFEAAADAIIAAGANGKIVFWNSAAARIFSFTADEALGQSLDLVTQNGFASGTAMVTDK
jgi:PAS domain S-box-containing protein